MGWGCLKAEASCTHSAVLHACTLIHHCIAPHVHTQDQDAKLKAMVDNMGGIDAVLEDERSMQRVVGFMGMDQQLGLAVVSGLGWWWWPGDWPRCLARMPACRLPCMNACVCVSVCV